MDIFKFPFIKSIFSEPDGTGSCSRVLIAAIVAFILGAGAVLLTKIHASLLVADINSFLQAAGMFITTTCTPMYLINKGGNVVNNHINNQNTQVNQNLPGLPPQA